MQARYFENRINNREENCFSLAGYTVRPAGKTPVGHQLGKMNTKPFTLFLDDIKPKHANRYEFYLGTGLLVSWKTKEWMSNVSLSRKFSIDLYLSDCLRMVKEAMRPQHSSLLKIASVLMADRREYNPNMVESLASSIQTQTNRCWLHNTTIVVKVTFQPVVVMAVQINTMITSLIGLVMFCLFTAEIYHYYGHHIKLVISRRSLGKGKKLTHLEVKFPKNYHATGRLFLPHSKIVEPFEIWFTSELNRSRIDYYYGMWPSNMFIWHLNYLLTLQFNFWV